MAEPEQLFQAGTWKNIRTWQKARWNKVPPTWM